MHEREFTADVVNRPVAVQGCRSLLVFEAVASGSESVPATLASHYLGRALAGLHLVYSLSLSLSFCSVAEAFCAGEITFRCRSNRVLL